MHKRALQSMQEYKQGERGAGGREGDGQEGQWVREGKKRASRINLMQTLSRRVGSGGGGHGGERQAAEQCAAGGEGIRGGGHAVKARGSLQGEGGRLPPAVLRLDRQRGGSAGHVRSALFLSFLSPSASSLFFGVAPAPSGQSAGDPLSKISTCTIPSLHPPPLPHAHSVRSC